MAQLAHHHVRAFAVLAVTTGLHPNQRIISMAQQPRMSTTCTSICGEGNAIMYPDAVIQFQDVFGQDRLFGCNQAQKMVESGLAPEGFCSDMVLFALAPCGCVRPDGTPASAAPVSPRPVGVVAGSPTPAAAPAATNGASCPRRRQALDDCLSNIYNGDDCMSCVTSYYSLFATTCRSIDQETCTGLANCPCGVCLNRFLRYIKCLSPQCASQMCQVNGTDAPSPARVPPRESPSPTRPKVPSRPSSASSSIAPSFVTASERNIFSGAGADRPGENHVALVALAALTSIIAAVLT